MDSPQFEFNEKQKAYALKHDLPLVALMVDARHVTGPLKDRLVCAGPVTEDFAREVRELIKRWEGRFDGQEPT